MKVRVAFLGNDEWSVPPLRALVDDPAIEVILALTNPPRPAGRGSAPRRTAVALAAGDLNVDVLEVEGARSVVGMSALGAARPDALAVVAYGEILTREVLEVAPLGAVNLHFSLLPRWRGAAPVQRAILAGDQITGATAMLMDESLDTGPILAQTRVGIEPDEDAGSLGARVSLAGAPLLVFAIRSLAEGTASPQIQDASAATSARKLTPEERWLDWSEPAEQVVRRVRALGPDPGASTRVDEKILKVFRAEVVSGGGEPGLILSVDRDGIVVAAGEGAVRPLQVALAGRRRMDGAEWARGARLVPGRRIG